MEKSCIKRYNKENEVENMKHFTNKLNSYYGQKYRWEGKPTHRQWTWVVYYDDPNELFNILIDKDIIHDDDINNYIINEYDLEKIKEEAEEKEDWDIIQEKVDNIRCHEMTQNEIESMIAHQTSNAYYQEFIDIEEERKEDEDN